MQNKGLINEVFWLRCIACLAVTFGHAIQNGYVHFNEPGLYQAGSYVIYMWVLFGVPVFVFISEFLLSHKYAQKMPAGFFQKRLKILLVPYLFMSAVYALFEVQNWSTENLMVEIGRNIFLGESTVYFVLIIFQFYILHKVAGKYLDRRSPKVILPVAFFINFAYLAFFNFVEAPNHPIAEYIWNPGYWLPFAGWIFYFTLGYYCGRDYEKVTHFIKRYNKTIFVLPIVTFMIVLVADRYLTIDDSSKRIDMLLFTSSIILLILLITRKVNKLPKLVLLISNYSFSIFLLNEVFLTLFLVIPPPEFFNILSYSVVTFFLSIVLSIYLSYLLNKFRFGKYFVGQIMQFRPEGKGKNRGAA